MTLENTLLEKLSEWQPGPGRQDFNVSAAGWSATLTADRCDALGCLLWELNLRRDGTAEADLQKWAAAAVERVTGLMEPLRIIEVDTIRNEAQLRSQSPLERAGKRLYFELLLRGNATAILRRYQAANEQHQREQVTFVMTHEALARLTSDLADAVGGG